MVDSIYTERDLTETFKVDGSRQVVEISTFYDNKPLAFRVSFEAIEDYLKLQGNDCRDQVYIDGAKRAFPHIRKIIERYGSSRIFNQKMVIDSKMMTSVL